MLLAGLVLAGGFIATFVWQTVLPTSGREPLGELRVIVLALCRVLVAIALLIGVLRDEAAKGRIADLVVRLDGLPPLPVLQASLAGRARRSVARGLSLGSWPAARSWTPPGCRRRHPRMAPRAPC